MRWWAVVVWIASCGDAVAPRPPRWECPRGWVAHELGGCGPAQSLCASAGGRGADDPNDCAEALAVAAPGDLAAEVGAPDGPPPVEHQPAMEAAECPAGWTQVEGVACAPALSTACPPGSEPLPGGGCTATSKCARDADDYPTVPAEAAGLPALHVRAGAVPAVADGSPLLPYPTLATALAAVPPGAATVIRIADGRYVEAVTLDRAVTLVGACPAAVAIETPGPGPAVRVTGTGTRASVRGMALGGAGIGLLAEAGASVVATSVVVREATRRGVLADGEGAAIEISDAVVERTRTGGTDEGRYGRGIQAWRAGTVRARRVVVQDVTQVGVHAVDRAELSIEDSLVRRVAVIPDGEYGLGLSNTDSRLRIDRVAVLDCAIGIQTWGQTEVRTLAVRGARSPRPGFGVIVGTDGTLDATGVLVEDVDDGQGIRVQGDSVLRSAVVRDVASTADPPGPATGFHVEPGVSVEVSSLRISDTVGYGVVAAGPGTVATFEHVSIAGVAASPDWIDTGLFAGGGARVLVRDARIEAGTDFSLASAGRDAKTGAPTLLTIEDAVVLGPAADAGGIGIGATSQDGATLQATRVLFEGARRFGAMSRDGGETILERSVVRRVLPSDIGYGYGVAVGGAGRVTLRASRLEEATEVGMTVFGGGVGVVEDSVVARVSESPLGGGWGLLSQLDADLTVRRTRVEAMAEVGVVADAGRLVLEDVVVRDVSTGARGYGAGLTLIDAEVDATRVALERTASAGVIVSALEPETPLRRTTLTDLYIRGIDSAALGWRPGLPYEPVGPQVAYGVHVVQAEAIVARAVIAEGGHGFYVAAGALSLSHAVITGHLDAAGAIDRGSYTLEDVRVTGNARDEVIEAALPVAATLPPPTGLCIDLDPCE